MATQACRDFEDAIGHFVAGRLHAIAPERMAALEAHVNGCAACAARMESAGVVPGDVPDEAVAPPNEDEWAKVWSGIEQATARTVSAPRPGRWLRTVQTWGAIAAALALTISVWQFGAGGAESAWVLELARGDDTEISSIEVFGDSMPMVLFAGDDEISVIWVFENEET